MPGRVLVFEKPGRLPKEDCEEPTTATWRPQETSRPGVFKQRTAAETQAVGTGWCKPELDVKNFRQRSFSSGPSRKVFDGSQIQVKLKMYSKILATAELQYWRTMT